MIQLTYEPAFDPLHAMFRALRLRESLNDGLRVPRNLFRILDFYVLFPASLRNMKFRQEHRRLKVRALEVQRAPAYGGRPEDAVLFERIRPFQEAAVETLALQRYFSAEALVDGWAVPGNEVIPESLAYRIHRANELEAPLMEALATIAVDYPLEGTGGLKDRSGLMEHRYDAV